MWKAPHGCCYPLKEARGTGACRRQLQRSSTCIGPQQHHLAVPEHGNTAVHGCCVRARPERVVIRTLKEVRNKTRKCIEGSAVPAVGRMAKRAWGGGVGGQLPHGTTSSAGEMCSH